jgi:hypothetical protein
MVIEPLPQFLPALYRYDLPYHRQPQQAQAHAKPKQPQSQIANEDTQEATTQSDQSVELAGADQQANRDTGRSSDPSVASIMAASWNPGLIELST